MSIRIVNGLSGTYSVVREKGYYETIGEICLMDGAWKWEPVISPREKSLTLDDIETIYFTLKALNKEGQSWKFQRLLGRLRRHWLRCWADLLRVLRSLRLKLRSEYRQVAAKMPSLRS
jgi:hypothetical protein